MHPEQSSKPKATVRDFVCRFALHSGQGNYYEFDWEEHHRFALSSKPTHEAKSAWRANSAHITVQNKRQKKQPALSMSKGNRSETDSDSEEKTSDYEHDEEEDEEEIGDELSEVEENDDIEEDDDGYYKGKSQKSPSKDKRRLKLKMRPTKRKQAILTPDSKVALRTRGKRKGAGRDFPLPRLATDYLRLENLPSDPYLRAMRLLHVGARPDALPCREDEYMEVMSAVLSLLEEGSGGCVCE